MTEYKVRARMEVPHGYDTVEIALYDGEHIATAVGRALRNSTEFRDVTISRRVEDKQVPF